MSDTTFAKSEPYRAVALAGAVLGFVVGAALARLMLALV
jgi:ElaB/YqjD/DUF883 family membrane-anchored ribosome-binding protein